jgi:flagellar P-ring protein precursor FlgI
MIKKILTHIMIVMASVGCISSFAATRIKDIARIDGVRDNQLYGYGLVIGLNGTGDKSTTYTVQSVGNMLRRMGVTISPADVVTQIKSRNVAAVIVTADLPAFVKSGNRMDVVVSSIGDATSLHGGVLLQTPLYAADSKVYAVAQGQITTALGAGSRTPASGPLNVARISNGALIEKEVTSTMVKDGAITIMLNHPDFTTAERLIQSINEGMTAPLAHATDAGTIKVDVPQDYHDNIIGLIARVESLPINPDTIAKVIINERTGTIVVGRDVKISSVAVTHGNITVQIQSSHELSEATVQSRNYPPKGELVSNSDSKTVSGEGMTHMVVLEEGVNINELVKALNALGVAPKDLIAILQAMKEAGALQAEIVVI